MPLRSFAALLLSSGLALIGFAFEIHPLPSPAAAGALGSSFAVATDGAIYLAWVEPSGADRSALHVARYDAAENRWGDTHRVAEGGGWLVNPLNFPKIAAHPGGKLAATWAVLPPGTTNPHDGANTFYAESSDDGRTWSEPRPLSRESHAVFFATLLPLPDGRTLALWIDGRNRRTNGHRQGLFANFLGADAADTELDRSICDCCEIRLALTPRGATAVYRGRSDAEIRDILAVTLADGSWTAPTRLHADEWKINGCPMNGPQIAARDATAVAAWFTSADDAPRALATVSRDGAKTFGEALRIDLGRAQGRVDTAVLADGTAVVTWLETKTTTTPGGIYLRTISSAGEMSDPRLLVPAEKASAIAGFPRVAVLGSGQVLLTYTRGGNAGGIESALVSL